MQPWATPPADTSQCTQPLAPRNKSRNAGVETLMPPASLISRLSIFSLFFFSSSCLKSLQGGKITGRHSKNKTKPLVLISLALTLLKRLLLSACVFLHAWTAISPGFQNRNTNILYPPRLRPPLLHQTPPGVSVTPACFEPNRGRWVASY